MPSAIEIEVVGEGAFRGSKSAITSYSVQEAITPLEVTGASPGAGTIGFGATENAASVYLLDSDIELKDGARGVVTGKIRSVGSGDLALNVTADSVLVKLNVTQSALPFIGTLADGFAYYLSLAGIAGGFEVSSAIASRSVTLPGFRDNLLDKITQLCVAQQVEMAVVYDNIVLREPRSNTATEGRNTSLSWSVDRGSPAKSVEVYYYNYRQITDGVFFPSTATDWQGAQVGPGETLDPIYLQTNTNLASVLQPVPGNDPLPDPALHPTGVYGIYGNDEVYIPAQEWIDKGGKLELSIDPEDSTQIILKITGMNYPDDPRAPYRIGYIGDLKKVAGVYFRGTGLSFDKKKLVVSTGATNTQQEVGSTVDNPMITSIDQAATAAQKSVLQFSGLSMSISGNASTITKASAGAGFATSPLAAFDAEFSPGRLSDLDARGWKFADFDQFFANKVINQFSNQLFGNGPGARILREDQNWRISSVTTNESTVSYTANPDTLLSDWDAAWAGKKLSDWDAAWAGKKLRQFDITPLRGG